MLTDGDSDIHDAPQNRPDAIQKYVTIARVFKTQGRFGEVAAESHSDIPGRFVTGLKLRALGEDGKVQSLIVEDRWEHKGYLVLKFTGVDSISAAEELVGCELQVPVAERAGLEAGWTYVSDLTGSLVYDGERLIGKVEEVRFGAGEAPLLIVVAGSKEYEIPYASAYIEKQDLEQRKLQMRLPEGMLDLNAPMTSDEKQLQQQAKRGK